MSEAQNVLEKLSGAEVAGVKQAGPLQVFALKWRADPGVDYVTLDEALADSVLDVTEIDEGGQVQTIKVVNKSNRMVFMMAGELLVGCKQDRVLNTSMLVRGKSDTRIPVACVEAGRWGYRSRRFSSGESSSHSSLRMLLSRQSSNHYRAQGTPGSDQGAVWAEVARKMGKMGSSSSSAALQDMFKDYAEKLDGMLRSLSAPAGCHGAVFVINGKITGADLFDRPATVTKVWPKLINGYAIDALEEPEEKPNRVQGESVTEWLKAASLAKQEWFDSPGLGQDVRIEGEQLVGAALVVEQQPVHLQLFREEKKK